MVTASQRWFGATGRKVPAVVLAGTTDLGGALELDDVTDEAALRAAHAAGTPVVVRASSAGEIATALARPEVACVLVTDEALLAIDLTDQTYG
jgi:hypothetical protein